MLAWASPPTLLRRALLRRDRIVTGRIVNRSRRTIDVPARSVRVVAARGGGLRPDAVFRASAVRWPGGKLALR